MPGSGTRKGGTMTGENVGIPAVGWATLCGMAVDSRDMVCTAATDDGMVETVTMATGDMATVEVTVATGVRSATIEAAWEHRHVERACYTVQTVCVIHTVCGPRPSMELNSHPLNTFTECAGSGGQEA